MQRVHVNFGAAVQGTPPSVYDVQATASDWDLIMNNSQPPSRRMSGASPSAVPYQNKVCPLHALKR